MTATTTPSEMAQRGEASAARKQPSAPMSYWRQQVKAQADFIAHQIDSLQLDEAERPRAAAVKEHLRDACKAANILHEDRRPFLRRAIDWLQGASVAGAFFHLHAAQALMVDLLPEDKLNAQIPSALRRLQGLNAKDRRRKDAEAALCDKNSSVQHRRAALSVAVQEGYELIDYQFARVRSFRNILLAGALALTLVTAVICFVGAVNPEAIPLCVYETVPVPTPPATPGVQGQSNLIPVACPASRPTPQRTPGPSPADTTLVALFGLVGGALSATLSIRKLRGTSTPYSVPFTLAMLKLPSGALTAVLGLLLVQADFIPGLSQLDSQEQILAYAVVLGFAQQIATKFLDQQAQDVLDRVPTKESPSAGTDLSATVEAPS
jgi:hypothetical protein